MGAGEADAGGNEGGRGRPTRRGGVVDVDRRDLGADQDRALQPGQQRGAGVAAEPAQGQGGDADVGGVVLAEQAGAD